MNSKLHFIKATEEFNTFEKEIPAYYFRKSYTAQSAHSARIRIAVCGFYELYLNGTPITKGFLSPYISNPDDLIYYDEYDVTFCEGENVIGVWLGNGFQNNPGGYIWDFDTASFRSAPMFSMEVTQGDTTLFYSDGDFKIFPSPIRSDDYRFGEYYDANFEIDGWNRAGFCDTAWSPALPATAPKGELRLADIAPIVKETELLPVSITPCKDGGYIYDFGQSNAGVCRLCVKGTKGQRIELRHADSLCDGDLNLAQVWFVRDHWERDKEIVHRDVYICKGEGTEVYRPTFTYHGFRYVKVNGITEAQATKELLTYLVFHTDLQSRGGFDCSDHMATTLQEITRRSILSNFHHFPTDCPQREKNGWTADAALSCEAAMLNFNPERNYREWMQNIRRAQRQDGALPGIVPTGGWGFHWGNGPAWDCVMTYIPYFAYRYRGETEMIEQSAEAFVQYLRYLRSRCDENGLLSIGLGDWCQVGGGKPVRAPLVVTDSIISMDIANKMAEMLDAVQLTEAAGYARNEAKQYRKAIRSHLVNLDTMTVLGECQTCQAMGLFYGVFEKAEEQKAFDHLLPMIHALDDHFNVGVLGGRVIFHVLSKFGYSDLAYHMITREDYPSYGNWVKRGATTLWENFYPDKVASMNHHFWGDISAWFIKCVAGLQLNPEGNDVNTLKIKPAFIKALDHATAHHVAPAGRISIAWKKQADCITLDVEIPSGMKATAELPSSFQFEDGEKTKEITSGTYKIVKQ